MGEYMGWGDGLGRRFVFELGIPEGDGCDQRGLGIGGGGWLKLARGFSKDFDWKFGNIRDFNLSGNGGVVAVGGRVRM